MKKVMFLFMTMALTLVTMTAQQPQDRKAGNRGEIIKARITQLKTDLNLNDDQLKKVETLFTSQDQQIKELRKKAEAGQEANRDKMKQLKEERVAGMKSILTAEQFQKYSEFGKMTKKGMGEDKKNESTKTDTTIVKKHHKKR